MRKIRFYLPAFGLAAVMAGALCIPAEETLEEIAAEVTPEQINVEVSLDEITAAVTDAAAPSEEPVPGMADLLGDVKRELGAESTQNDSEKAYVALREIQVYDYPDENGTVAGKLSFETKVEASASGKQFSFIFFFSSFFILFFLMILFFLFYDFFFFFFLVFNCKSFLYFSLILLSSSNFFIFSFNSVSFFFNSVLADSLSSFNFFISLNSFS